MDETSLESLPSVKITSNFKIRRESRDPTSPSKLDIRPDLTVTFSPVMVSSHSSDKFPASFKRDAARRHSINTAARTAAYGTPEIVKKIFTGQLPPTYFNDFCNGYNRDSPREFQYRGPSREREVPLWEPKTLKRTEARHKIRDIQDARFRKQEALQERERRKSVALSRKTAACLLSSAETMPTGKQAFLDKLDKEKDKYVQRCMTNKKTREAMIKLEGTKRRFSVYETDPPGLPAKFLNRPEVETERRQSVY